MASNWLTGRLLLATPALAHPTFHRTVILLLDHAEHGALGVVLNRPSALDVQDVLPSWQALASPPGRLFTGGPVSPESALCLARAPGDRLPDGVQRLVGPIAVVDLDTEVDALVGRVSSLRVFAGYAGWTSGQLEAEIREGSWFVVDAEPVDPFADEPLELWPTVLRRQPGDLAYVASYPADPALN